MAKISGYVGAVYVPGHGVYHPGISFIAATSTIHSDRDDFVTAGFTSGSITVYGTTSNDGDYTISTVDADEIVTDESVVNESPTSSVLVYESAVADQVAGFYGWNVNWSVDSFDITDFDDSGLGTYLAGTQRWTGTAQKHWSTVDNCESEFGGLYIVRFYVKYSATPSAPAPVYCYEGLALVSGIAVNVEVASLNTATLTFTGASPLRYRSLTAYP